MTVGELIRDLSGYDPEMEVKAWLCPNCITAPIVYVGQGYTDDVLDCHVSIAIAINESKREHGRK